MTDAQLKAARISRKYQRAGKSQLEAERLANLEVFGVDAVVCGLVTPRPAYTAEPANRDLLAEIMSLALAHAK